MLVGARLTLGGKTFLPENYVWKINKKPEFYDFPENARILHDNYPKKIFSRILGARVPFSSRFLRLCPRE